MTLHFLKSAIAIGIIGALSFPFFLKHPKEDEKKSVTAKGFAVVELFTSEGCSSCPPADKAVEKISQEFPAHVYVLGFHVDYWNNLGWKDAFSNADNSNRQRKYASAFKLGSIYTPQVIVNGKTEFVGSNESLLHKTVQSELQQTGSLNIQLEANSKDGKNITVNYSLDNKANSVLNIALVQLQATTSVKRGENGGRQLHHVNVVRDFVTQNLSDSNKGSVNFEIPGNLSKSDFKIIAFVQNKNLMEITGAGEATIQ